jgi:hypothetical protein
MRTSLTAAVLAAAVVPVLLTGCNAEVTTSDGSKASIRDGQPTEAPAATNASGGQRDGQAGGGTGTGQARPAEPAKRDSTGAAGSAGRVCNSIKAALKFQPKQPNTALITITNTGSRACSVNGWPGLRFTNAANQALPLRASKTTVPGVPQRIQVEAGGTAYASIKWKPCDKAAAGCNVVSGVEVFAPGGTRRASASLPEEVVVRQSFTIAKGSLQVGILTRTAGEALMWEDDGE